MLFNIFSLMDIFDEILIYSPLLQRYLLHVTVRVILGLVGWYYGRRLVKFYTLSMATPSYAVIYCIFSQRHCFLPM